MVDSKTGRHSKVCSFGCSQSRVAKDCWRFALVFWFRVVPPSNRSTLSRFLGAHWWRSLDVILYQHAKRIYKSEASRLGYYHHRSCVPSPWICLLLKSRLLQSIQSRTHILRPHTSLEEHRIKPSRASRRGVCALGLRCCYLTLNPCLSVTTSCSLASALPQQIRTLEAARRLCSRSCSQTSFSLTFETRSFVYERKTFRCSWETGCSVAPVPSMTRLPFQSQ